MLSNAYWHREQKIYGLALSTLIGKTVFRCAEAGTEQKEEAVLQAILHHIVGMVQRPSQESSHLIARLIHQSLSCDCRKLGPGAVQRALL